MKTVIVAFRQINGLSPNGVDQMEYQEIHLSKECRFPVIKDGFIVFTSDDGRDWIFSSSSLVYARIQDT